MKQNRKCEMENRKSEMENRNQERHKTTDKGNMMHTKDKLLKKKTNPTRFSKRNCRKPK